MTNLKPSSSPTPAIAGTVVQDTWDQLTDGLEASWLDDICSLRQDSEGLEISLDIWSVALTAELKNPDRRETASVVLSRVSRIDGSALN